MAKKNGKRRNGRNGGLTLPLAVVAGLAAPGIKIWEARGGGASGMAREAGRILTGFDFWNGTFNWQTMKFGLLPVAAGVLAHKVVGQYLGVNRLLAKSGIPVIRI